MTSSASELHMIEQFNDLVSTESGVMLMNRGMGPIIDFVWRFP